MASIGFPSFHKKPIMLDVGECRNITKIKLTYQQTAKSQTGDS